MIFQVELFIPELYLLALVGALFVLTVGPASWQRLLRYLPLAAGIGIGVAAVSLQKSGLMLYGAYQVDALSQFFKMAIFLGLAVTCLNAMSQPTLSDEKRPDYFLFLALSALGLMLLSSAVELVTIFLALELASYSIYALIPLRAREPAAAEAGIKYILFGAVVTALAMYGLSYILGVHHTTYLSELATKTWSWSESPAALIGIALFMGALFYKLALFPLHFWCPDVYEGASNETAAFVATLPKLGAVVVLVRMATLLDPSMEVTMLLAVLAALSMTFGNLSALVQTDLKRLLGYSSVSHAGYVMLGIVAGTSAGLAAAAFYAVVYLLMNLACFWVICRVSTDGRNLKLDDLNGLYQRSPGLALILAVSAFALVGLPPTAGFMGKLFLLNSAWLEGYHWLVIIAVLNSAIAIYYYLNLVRHAYTREAEVTAPALTSPGLLWGGLLAAAVLWLGMVPGTVFSLAQAAGAMVMP
ncbi:NADH-quinone oxidoreductase subunit N [Desulfonatronum thiosulfatophilum]|uniref:NADH-quinone oxidoreductase subunit N n=1 Tax=Desulfonatronum thiosulfatophilum TaxID=617002 RepID=A0A1G6BS84_9BACT|nr:NADH-quinone oxidoreductase subunit N [Desulfonatronum thiosulfatophilum]